MDWHGRPRERTDFSDFDLYVDANSYNTAPHSYYNVPQHPSSTLPIEYSGSSHNKDYAHFLGNNGDGYFASSYVQDSVAAFQAPFMPISTAPRVHINPNYRPKAAFGPSKDASSNRPASVHINPHWKPRAEPEPIADKLSRLQRENHSNQTFGKKTIFVNPKVLAQINFKQSSEKRPVSDLNSRSPIPEIHCLKASSIPTTTSNSVMKNVNFDDAKGLINNRQVLPASAPDPSFVTFTSRKLICKPNVTSHQKPLNSIQANIPVLPNETIGSTIEESIKRFTPSSTPNKKTTRQHSSKYKLVRNSSSIQNTTKNVRGVLAHPSRRSRRKSASFKTTSAPPKSVYKFIRKPGASDSTGSPTMKVLKRFGNVTSFPGQSTPRKNPSSSSNFGARKNVRTRFRLVKFEPSLERGQASIPVSGSEKTMHSRYKIVHQGFKSSVQMNNTSVCGFPLYSSLVRSKFKSLVGNRPYQGRKVSRFRIIHTYKSRMKTPSLVKISNSHQCSGLYKNIIWQKDKVSLSSQSDIHRRVFASIATSSKKKGNAAPTSMKITNRRLVNIGGVLYRSSRTSLTRTQTGKSKEQIVHIRGKTFVMDGQGKTLRPAISTDSSADAGIKNGKLLSIARVDIGGVTFTRRSDNTLVRTNTHYARNLLSIAKTRSIALLTDKLRKNNQPCLIYHRFGKCHAQLEGKCWRVHDPKNVAICRKFLQGSCETEKCLLSHDVGPEKMPTCHHFLDGCCVRDNCPYLHVKLSAGAAICRQFLHGYCAAGDMCKKRHVFLCPDYEKDRKCKKGKYCPYPHKSSAKVKSIGKTTRISTTTFIAKKSSKVVAEKIPPLSVGEVEKRKRYYDENSERNIEQPQDCKQLDLEAASSNLSKEHLNNEDSDVSQKRPEIGVLPAYIPL